MMVLLIMLTRRRRMPRLRPAATVTVRIEAAAVFVVVPAAVSATDVAVSSTASSGSGCASHGPTELVAALRRRSAAAAHRRDSVSFIVCRRGLTLATIRNVLVRGLGPQTATDDGQTSLCPGLPVTTIRLLHLLSITDRMLVLMSISLSHFDGYKHLAFLPTNAGTLVSCFRLETMGTRCGGALSSHRLLPGRNSYVAT